MLLLQVCMVLSRPHHSSISKALFLTLLAQVKACRLVLAAFLLQFRLIVFRAVARYPRLKRDFCLEFSLN
jgi:hypothetical protein